MRTRAGRRLRVHTPVCRSAWIEDPLASAKTSAQINVDCSGCTAALGPVRCTDRSFATSLPMKRTQRAIAAYAAALLHNMPPFSYFSFRLYESGRRRTAPLFLFATDVPGFAALNGLRGANNEDVQDKLTFACLCSEHALPCI